MKKNYLVVTGSNDLTAFKNHNIYAIGEHCLINDGVYDFQNSKKMTVIKFHWKDRKKLEFDYKYLENLFEKVLKYLTFSLNQYHGTNNNSHYWRIVLSPWILDYLSVIFDRWENITVATNDYKLDTFLIQHSKDTYTIDYKDFKNLSYTDNWNSKLYEELIRFRKININIQKTNLIIKQKDDTNFSFSNKKSTPIVELRKSLLIFLSKIFSNKKTLIKSLEFNFLSFLKISFLSKNLFFNDKYFERYLSKSFVRKHDRENFKIDMDTVNDFEVFLKKRMIIDLPMAYLENYKFFLKNIPKYRPEKIFTANDHYWNEYFKIFSAECVNKGSELNIVEHGGSIVSKFRIFNFEEKISNKKITWCKPFIKNQFQFMPPKYIFTKKNNGKLKRKILIMLSSFNTHTPRCRCGPLSSLWKEDIDQKINLITKICDLAKKNKFSIHIRSGNDDGWGNNKIIEEIFGNVILSKEKDAIKDIISSDLVVCPYPETSFSDCVMTNTPSILLYENNHWEFENEFKILEKKMKEKKIIFNNPNEAMDYINEIIKNPHIWWKNDQTTAMIEEFKSQCCISDSSAIKKWSSLFI